jgi:pimeloyl-ACP methyl ester carboxylesterase
MAINTPNGIDEAMVVRIDGIDQWITVRGQDRDNPVILMLHGGPGVTNCGFAVSFVPWEKDFTIVQWDQPGAGRTFGRAERIFPRGLTIESMTRDGIEVAEFLKTHLHKDRVIILGWSWGSVLGIHMVQSRPDLFSAYVGTGQIVNMQAGEAIVYARVLDAARSEGNSRAIKELESVGPPPYKTQAALGTQRKWAATLTGGTNPILEIAELALLAPRTSLGDAWSFMSGVLASQNHFLGPSMDGEMMKVDLADGNKDFAIPIFVFQGADDDFTPAQLAQAYVEGIRAPQKRFILITGAAHDAVITRSDEFLELLVRRVRPLAVESESITRSAQSQYE